MNVRVKFAVEDGTRQATLLVDGAPVTTAVMAERFPCPSAADAGLDCLDVALPEVADPRHQFVVILREDTGRETMIGLPSLAVPGSHWHPLLAPGFFTILVVAVLAGRAVRSTTRRGHA